MKLLNFIIFISIVSVLYFFLNFYIYKKGVSVFSSNSNAKIIFTITFLFVSLSYILGRIFEKAFYCQFSTILIWIGSFWIAFILYLFLFSVIIDIIKFSNHYLNYLPKIIFKNPQMTKYIVFSVVMSVSGLIILLGYLNADSVNIKTLNLYSDKTSDIKQLKIVVASDIHAGIIMNSKRIKKFVNEINALNPDIVLFAGDVVDEDIEPVIKDNIGDEFKNIKSKYGVFAITGNHEYIGGADKSIEYLEKYNINFLRDEIVTINNITIIGREDKEKPRFTKIERKTLKELMDLTNKNNYLILMNHQPFNLYESVENNIDLQVSGHTHNGQMFPLNFITGLLYEVSWGYKKIKDTHFYVSSGYGTWGPPVKTTGKSEIVEINLNFK